MPLPSCYNAGMVREEILRTVQNRREGIRDLGVRRLALFGSAARGEATSDSDLDFLVEFQGPATFDRLVELQFLLEDLFNRPIDLVTAASIREPLRHRIEREAIDLPGLSPLPR